MSFISTIKYNAVVKKNGVLLPVVNIATRQGDNMFQLVKPYGKHEGALRQFWVENTSSLQDALIVITKTSNGSVRKIKRDTGEEVWATPYYGSYYDSSLLKGGQYFHIVTATTNVIHSMADGSTFKDLPRIPNSFVFDPEGRLYVWESPLLKVYHEGDLIGEFSGDYTVYNLRAGFNRVYLLAQDKVVCLNREGVILWEVPRVSTYNAPANGLQVVDELDNPYLFSRANSGTTTSYLQVYDAQTGNVLFERTILSNTVIGENQFNSNTVGHPIFFTEWDSEYSYIAQFEDPGMGSANRYLLYLHKVPKTPEASGTWSISLPCGSGLGPAAYCHPYYLKNSEQIIVSHGNEVSCIDAATGNVEWTTNIGVRSHRIIEKTENVVYILTHIRDDSPNVGLYEMDISTGDYTVRSSNIFPTITATKFLKYGSTYTQRVFWEEAQEKGCVYVWGDDGFIDKMYKVDLETGDVLWSIPETVKAWVEI